MKTLRIIVSAFLLIVTGASAQVRNPKPTPQAEPPLIPLSDAELTLDCKSIVANQPDFVADEVFPSHKLSFELGEEKTDTYFDNVVLQDLSVTNTNTGFSYSTIQGAIDATETFHLITPIGSVNGTLIDDNLLTKDSKIQLTFESLAYKHNSFSFSNFLTIIPFIPISGLPTIGNLRFICFTCLSTSSGDVDALKKRVGG